MLFDGAFRPPAGTGYGKRASSAIEVEFMSEAIFIGGFLGGWQADGGITESARPARLKLDY